MNDLYQKVLNATLALKTPADPSKVTENPINYVYKISNDTPIPLVVSNYSSSDKTSALQGHYIPPGKFLVLTDQFVGDCHVAVCAATGGFVGAAWIEKVATADSFKAYKKDVNKQRDMGISTAFTVKSNLGFGGLTQPNDIIDPPALGKTGIVPADSYRMVVGAGKFFAPAQKKNVLLLHEQYWRRSSASFSIGPGSKKSIALVVTTGRTEATTVAKVFQTSLGIDVSGGWGPISGHMSAQLEYSASFNHSVTVSETTEVSVQDDYENKLLDKHQLYLYWNLVDVYSFIDFDGNSSTQPPFTVLAVIESVQSPAVLRVYPRPLS